MTASSSLKTPRELQCLADDQVVAPHQARRLPPWAELVRSTLRLRPRPHRRPARSVAARRLDLLKAWGTGHPGGIATLHAGSAAGALSRLEQLIQEAVVTVPRPLIAEAVDVIVMIVGRGAARRVRDIVRVTGLGPDGAYRLQSIQLSTGEAQMKTRRIYAEARTRIAATAALLLGSLSTAPAYAAGSSMPWEQPLQQILDSVQGPVAKIVAVIIIITTGLALAFGDSSGGFRKLIQIVFGLSIAFAASSLLPQLLQLQRRGAGLMAGDSTPRRLRGDAAPLADRADPDGRRPAGGGHLGRHPGRRHRHRPAALVRRRGASGWPATTLAVWAARADNQFPHVFGRHLKHRGYLEA